MSALNSLPLPVVRLLAFFHEELSERRPGRVPQTVQLWVGCLLVILISMTFEIPFVAAARQSKRDTLTTNIGSRL